MDNYRIILCSHTKKRMFERKVTLREVKDAIQLGKIIETYSERTPYPSILLLYWNDLRPLHVVVAIDDAYKTKWVITVYEPDIDTWEVGFERQKVIMCVFCRTGILHKGITTVTLERDNTIVIFKEVPALVCNQCGEAYTDEEVTENLLDMAEQEMAKGRRQKEEFIQYTVPDAEEKLAL